MGIDHRDQRKLDITDSIPESDWCEARVLYITKQMTVKEIADVYHCAERTASRMIRENRNLEEIGKQRTPHKIDDFKEVIEFSLRSTQFRGMYQISSVSNALFNELQPRGYSGSAKTIERYLRTISWKELVTSNEG